MSLFFCLSVSCFKAKKKITEYSRKGPQYPVIILILSNRSCGRQYYIVTCFRSFSMELVPQ